MIKIKKQFVLLLTSMIAVGYSQAGLDAVELSLLPANLSLKCNRSFFKSTDRNNRALFVTPHVVAGRSPIAGGAKEIFIDTGHNEGEYFLTIGLFFPQDAGDNNNSYEIQDAQANFCDFSAVVESLNESLALDPKYKLTSPVHLPLTSFDVVIPALGNKTATIGRVKNKEQDEEADILEYVDRSYTAQYTLNEEELERVITLMARPEGMHLDVRFRFQASQIDGKIEVNVDADEFKTAFDTQISGRPKFLGKLEVEAAIQAAINNIEIEVIERGGITEASEKTREKILDRLIGGLDFSIKEADLPENAEFEASKKDEGLLDVELVSKTIISKFSKGFSYTRTTSAQDTTVAVPTRVHSEPVDPNIKNIRLKDGFNPVTFPKFVSAGESINITPGYTYMVNRVWDEKMSFIRLEQFTDLGIHELFGPVLGGKFDLSNDSSDELGTFGVAKDCGTNFLGLTWLSGYCASYRFFRVQRFPIKERNRDFVHFYISDKSNPYPELKKTPISIAFSQVGGSFTRFTLDQVLEGNEYWSARMVGKSIIIDAHRDLGLLTFRDTFPRLPLSEEERGELYPENRVFHYGEWNVDEKGNIVEDSSGNGGIYPKEIVEKSGKYLEVYIDDEIILDEVLIDPNWGRASTNSPPNIPGSGIPIRGRVDTRAIKQFKAIALEVSNPYPTPEEEDIIGPKLETPQVSEDGALSSD